MTRVSVTLPPMIHQQIHKLAEEENDSVSYTIARLVEIGLMVLNSKHEKNEPQVNELEEYCQKLIIQINGIIKEIALNQFNLEKEKIAHITKETLAQFRKLKGVP